MNRSGHESSVSRYDIDRETKYRSLRFDAARSSRHRPRCIRDALRAARHEDHAPHRVRRAEGVANIPFITQNADAISLQAVFASSVSKAVGEGIPAASVIAERSDNFRGASRK